MRLGRLVMVAATAVALAAPAAAQQNVPATETIKGQILEIRQSTATENQGTFTEIKVRTRTQQETWLRLGPAEEMDDQFRAGDRIRAHVVAGDGAEPMNVRRIRNDRTGRSLQIRDAKGTLLRDQDRTRDRDQTGDRTRDRDQSGDRVRDRDRIHQPGTGGGQGPGGGGQGSGGGQGGGRP
jgi:hypothetical protein